MATWIDADHGWYGEDGILVACPLCASTYQHHGVVEDIVRDGDSADARSFFRQGNRLIPAPDDYNPSPRRNAVRIEINGECGHDWWLDIIQHKGQTFIFAHERVARGR